MEHEFDTELSTENSGHEATLNSMFECCNQLKELAHASQDSSVDELQAILEEHTEHGYGVFSINDYDDIADPIEDDSYAFSLLKAAVERRKEEGVSVKPTHTIVSSCGNVLLIDAEDLSLCTLVRNVG